MKDHKLTFERSQDLLSQRFKLESAEHWFSIIPQILPLHFKEEWDVKIIPPFSGAITRFYISYNDRFVSVYLDWYDRLGIFKKPYYEIYDGEDTKRYSLDNTDEMMSDIDQILNGTSLEDLSF